MKRERVALALVLLAFGVHLGCGDDATGGPMSGGADADAGSSGDGAARADGSAAPGEDAAPPPADAGDGGTSSDAAADAASDADAAAPKLAVFPNPATILVGAAPVQFEAQITVPGLPPQTTSVTWTLTGPGVLSATTGETVMYTPPATLGDVTTATLTASVDGATAGVATIELKSGAPTGALYTVTGRVSNSTTGNTSVNLNVDLPTAAFPSAVVRVNGVTIPFAGGRYQGSIGTRVAEGGAINVAVTVPEGEITSTSTMPAPAVVTSPAAGAALPPGDLVVTWTSTPALRHRGGISLNPFESAYAPVFGVAPGVTTTTIAAVPASKAGFVYVVARSADATFMGPVAVGSAFSVESAGPASNVPFTTTP